MLERGTAFGQAATNMKARFFTRFILLSVFFAAAIAAGMSVHASAPIRPNIIYIMADDLGIGDVKCFGGDRCRIETPGFDRVAREGMRFTDAHAVASVCVPSRKAIMTGRYPWRFNAPRPSGPWGFLNPRLATDQFTLARMLGRAGYRTGYVGKWHLGTLMRTKDGKNQGPANVDYESPLKIGPNDYGFDYSFILPGSLDMFPYVYARNGHWVGRVNRLRGWSAFNRVGPTEETFEDHKVLNDFSNEMESFISRNAGRAKQGDPFFLYFALTAPHTPTSPSRKFEGRSDIGVYGDFVMETDDCVARVLKALDQHGLADNTLVMATSDHGAASYAGPVRKATPGQVHEMEKIGHWPSGIYRGYKFSIYEGGTRVPFVARWPGVTKAGSTCDRLIGLNDLMATLADITGQQLAPDQAPDSISFLPLLRNAEAAAPRKKFIFESTRAFGVRDGHWKLAICPGHGCKGHLGNGASDVEIWRNAVKEFRGKATRADLRRAPFVQLFDLSQDPGETTNLAAKHPERVEAMIRVLETQSANGRSTPGPKLKNDTNGAKPQRSAPKFAQKD